MTQATEWKSRLICLISFNCEKTHKVWFKKFWNWLCDWDLIIFDLLAPPQGPRVWGPQKNCAVACAVACAIDVSYSHTKSGWISEKKILDHSTPHGTYKSDPWGMTQATEWKSRLICLYLSFLRRHTKFGWFCCFTSQVNSYGHCGTVSSPNHTFSWAGRLEQADNQ